MNKMVSPMKNVYLTFIIIGVLAFTLTGCNPETEEVNTIFAGGTNGLIVSWVQPNYETNTIFDKGQSSLNMVLSIKNDGEYEVKPGEAVLNISGIYPEDFGIKSTFFDNLPLLYAKRKDLEGNILEGSTELYELPNPLLFAGSVNGALRTTLEADICYKYVTFASAELCVGNSILNAGSNQDSSCNPSGERSVASSGAPVQVTSFRQQPGGPDKIMLTFVIEHKGNGQVFRLGSDGISCNPSKIRDRDYVHVAIGSEDNYWESLSCGLKGVREKDVRLENGKVEVHCTLDLKGDSVRNYVKSIPIKIDYLYSISTSVPLIVKETIGGEEQSGPGYVSGTCSELGGYLVSGNCYGRATIDSSDSGDGMVCCVY